ncbi:MAG: NAD(P) transhydrogenase subunit alpha [Myxococcales bacterium]|nr:NAD(P) transhydrogenase subunit alpha [Myxococcales bacterium]
MRVVVLKETKAGEHRVAQTPETVAKLVKAGVEVVIEAGAGLAAGFDDAAWKGATVAPDAKTALSGAQVVLSVQPVSEALVPHLSRGALLISFLPSARRPALAERGLDALAMEKVPRTTRGQAVDALSSQATVAGYKAVLLGASRLPRLLPMMTTAAGTLTPGKVLVLGAGVAGLQAIATAHRLGAQVSAFDVRAAVKEQVQSLGAKFVDIDGVGSAEGSGGYAKEVGADDQARIVSTLARVVPLADLVVSTAQIPGRPAPRLITADAVKAMRRGSVIVDLAADTGGNCELTQAGEEVVTDNGVLVLGPRDLAATMPLHASMMFAKNVLTLLLLCLKDGALSLPLEDELIAAMLVTHGGVVRHA